MLFQDYVCSRDKEKEVAISNMPVPISQPGKWLPGNDLCWPRIKEMVDWLLGGIQQLRGQNFAIQGMC